jgi:hypothetical protein
MSYFRSARHIVAACLVALPLQLATSQAAVFNANQAYIDEVTGPNSPNFSSSFGPFQVGYYGEAAGTLPGAGPSSFTVFTPTTGSGQHAQRLSLAPVYGFNFTRAGTVPAIAINTSSALAGGGYYEPKQILMHPGPTTSDANPSDTARVTSPAVFRFVTPVTGAYNFAGSFESRDANTGGPGQGRTQQYVFVDDAQLLSHVDATVGLPGPTGNSDSEVFPFDFTRSLAAGTTVDFVVSSGADGFAYDNEGFYLTVTTVPEPLVVGVVSVLPLLVLRRRAA